jgi:hypothetical protein
MDHSCELVSNMSIMVQHEWHRTESSFSAITEASAQTPLPGYAYELEHCRLCQEVSNTPPPQHSLHTLNENSAILDVECVHQAQRQTMRP